MQLVQTCKFSDFFENFLLTFVFDSWYTMGVDKREAHRTADRPDDESASTLTTERPTRRNVAGETRNDMSASRRVIAADDGK